MPRQLPLRERLDRLEGVLALAPGRIDDARIQRARAVLADADARLARGDEVVVAALCGGTGTGKSSLFNALAGAELSAVGLRRPTTSTVHAWVAGDEGPSAPVLEWLAVRDRHVGGRPVADNLVLLDLPDHDSVDPTHHEVTDRLVERVDVLVWVVDPLKYAQRLLHAGYLRRFAHHADVVVVVLNRIDELSEADRATCLADLRRLLSDDGVGAARVLATSARTGEGIDDLRRLLADEAAKRSAAARRIVGDLRAVAEDLGADLGAPAGTAIDEGRLGEALAGASGVGSIAVAAADTYVAVASDETRPALSRAARALPRGAGRLLRGVRSLLPTRADLPRQRPKASAAPASVRHAVIELADACSTGLPPHWRQRLRQVAGAESPALARTVADAVDGVPLRPPQRRWWSPFAALLTLFELAAAAGFVTLAVIAALAYLQLPRPDLPTVAGELPWPTALLLAGLLLRVLGGVARRRLVAVGAARHRGRVAADLRAAVEQVARDRVLGPLQAELDAHARMRAELASLLDGKR